MSKDVILVSLLWTLNRFHIQCSSVSSIKFEHVSAGWAERTEMPGDCKPAHNTDVESLENLILMAN